MFKGVIIKVIKIGYTI